MPAADQQQIFLLPLCLFLAVWQAGAHPQVDLTHDGPVVLGGNITFKAELYDSNGNKPSGFFIYKWNDDDPYHRHKYKTETTSNTTTYYTVSYPADEYHVGDYYMEVAVCKWWYLNITCDEYTSKRVPFYIDRWLNGNLTIQQTNKTISNTFVSSAETTEFSVEIRKGDLDYIKSAATSISVHWIIDCIHQNQTNDFKMSYNFTVPKLFHSVEALVVASFDPPPTTVAPTTTSVTPPAPPTNKTTTETPSNHTVSPVSSTTLSAVSTTVHNAELITPNRNSSLGPVLANSSFPFVCKSQLPELAGKVYGYFHREVNVRAPISDLKTDGATWIKPWNVLSLTVTCNGTGPFHFCFLVKMGKYNVTGNETCNESKVLDTCKFPLTHYFLDAWEYTVLIILSNDLGTERHPVAINIYKVTSKPQLSVIVVPVTCSLVAVVLIVFGIAYYAQSRARFTVEVADFDFGQRSADMEYKTFRERLRDSFNNAGYNKLDNSKDSQSPGVQ